MQASGNQNDNPTAILPSENNVPAPPPPVKPGRGGLGWLLATVWIIVLVLAWLLFHPLLNVEYPQVTPDPAGLFSFLLDLVLLALATLGSAGLGGWLLRLVWPFTRHLDRLEQALFSLGLGLGANIMLVLGLGLLAGVNIPVADGLLVVEVGLAVLWRWRYPPPAGPRVRPALRGWWQTAPGWERLAVAFCLAVATATLLLAMTPPVAWDSLMYHLEGPKRYIEAGRIEFLPRLGQSNFPFGAEMLFTWGMLLHGDTLAQAFGWLYGLLGALTCLAFARRFFGGLSSQARQRQAGWLAALFYLSVPHVWLLMTWAYTDTMLTFYTLLAFYALLLAVTGLPDVSNRVWLGYAVLGGIMAGLAWGGKYTAAVAGVAALGGVALLAIWPRRQVNWGRLFTLGLVYGLAMLLTFAPWLIRNIVWAGNPFAPLFGGIRGWSADEIAALAGSDGGEALTPAVVLGRPFAMVLYGQGGGLYDATISPLFLALLPLSLWAARRTRLLAGIWLALGLNYLGWLAGIRLSGASDHTRIILPAFPLLALATAYGLVAFSDWQTGPRTVRQLKLVAKGAVVVAVAVSSFWLLQMFASNDPLPFDLGLQTRDERLYDHVGQLYLAANFVNDPKNVPASANLYMFFEPRAYYFNRTLSYDHNSGGQFFYYSTRYPTPQAFRDELVRRGATHVLVGEELLKFLADVPSYNKVTQAKAGRQLLNDLESQGYFEKIYQSAGYYTIYKIR